VSGDGNGWAWCAAGHRHWGRFGAAGLLLTDGARVLLQLRAHWVHEGGVWAVPGGARDSAESAVDAALREAHEEAALDAAIVEPFDEWVDEHGGWSYTTVLADAAADVAVRPVRESDAIQWWDVDRVARLPLHHGFAAAWPHLRRLLADRAGRGDGRRPPP
jgi:8-oxo-dGTP pyrophosphatase MutT (NUDIX family)